jgi:hypothetical protein
MAREHLVAEWALVFTLMICCVRCLRNGVRFGHVLVWSVVDIFRFRGFCLLCLLRNHSVQIVEDACPFDAETWRLHGWRSWISLFIFRAHDGLNHWDLVVLLLILHLPYLFQMSKLCFEGYRISDCLNELLESFWVGCLLEEKLLWRLHLVIFGSENAQEF